MQKQNELRLAFFGTSHFSVVMLEKLKEHGILPTLLITAPDKPRGRKLLVTPPEAKVWAEDNNVDVLQPERLDEEFITELGNSEWDIFLIASYGYILPQKLLDLPRHGTLNVHPSLLPKYRGATPVEGQILADDRETGVTIMLIDEKMDHGPIIAQASIEIDKSDWPIKGSELRELLASEGGELLAEVIPKWIKGEVTPEEQEHKKATYVEKVRKEDAEIDLENDSYQNLLKIRAFDKKPGAYFFTEKNGKRMRVRISEASYQDGKLTIERVVPEGKKEMDYKDFLRG